MGGLLPSRKNLMLIGFFLMVGVFAYILSYTNVSPDTSDASSGFLSIKVEEEVTSKDRVLISGRKDEGATIFINNKLVEDEGVDTWSEEVDLEVGENEFTVRMISSGGKETIEVINVTRYVNKSGL